MTIPELRRRAKEQGLLKPGVRSRTELVDVLTKNVVVQLHEDENLSKEKKLRIENKMEFSSPKSDDDWGSDNGGFDQEDYVEDWSDDEKTDATYRLNFTPLISRPMEVNGVDVDTKDFDKASAGVKFDVLRAEWVGIWRYHPFYLISGDMVESGINEYSLSPTENYIDPTSTLKLYEKQDANYTQLANYLGLLELEEPLLKGHIIEILWWLVFGDFDFKFGMIVSRIKLAAQMKHPELLEILKANGYNGPIDRPACILAFATGKVVPGVAANEYTEYRDLVMNKDPYAIFMTSDLVLELLKIDGDTIVADMYGPYRLLALTMDNDKEPRPDIQICLRLTPATSLEISDKYGFEMYPDIVTENADSYLAVFKMVHSYYIDGVFGRKEAPAGKRLSQNELRLLTNRELIERFELDFSKLYYKTLKTYSFRAALIEEATAEMQKKQLPFWRMANESCDQKAGASYQYGISRDHVCFDSSLLDAETQSASKYPAFSTGLKDIEILPYGEAIGPILTFKQVISLADYIKDIDHVTATNYKDYLKDGYERDLIQIAHEYASQLKVQAEIREEYNALDQQNKVIIINLLLWAIHAGTSGVKDNYMFYEDIIGVFRIENYRDASTMLEKIIYTKIHFSKGLVFVTNDVMTFSKESKPEDLINFGDGYLQIFNFPPAEIESMLQSWRSIL